MKKIIFGLLLIVLIVVGVFVFSIARSFNADSYKTQIISSLEELTGRRVSCSDETSLSWRPQPTFIMNDLIISNQDGSATPNMLSVKQVQVEMDWSSFLRPSLVIKRIILKNPSILVERLHSYQTNFTFPYLFNPEQNVESDSIIGDSHSLTVKAFEVVDGAITYHNDLTSDTVVLNKISGLGRMESLNGPFSFKGAFNTANYTLDVDLKTNKLTVSEPVTGELNIKNSAGNTQINMNYSLFPNKTDDWLVLDASYSSQSPTELFDRLNLIWPDFGPLKGYFKLIISPQNNTLKEFVMVQGEEQNSVSCNIMFRPDETDKKDKLTFTMDKLDYVRWQPVLIKVIPFLFGQSHDSFLTDVSVNQLVWNDQSVSDVLIQGKVAQGVLNGNFSAVLPFESNFSISGEYLLNQHAVSGELNLQTPDLFPLIQWAYGKKTAWLPTVEKVAAQWTAKIDLSDKKRAVDIRLASIANTKISGSVDKEKDTLKTDLKIQSLNLDMYYPHLATTGYQTIQDWLTTFGQHLTDFAKNGQINLDIDGLKVFKKDVNQIVLKGKWADRIWDVEQLSLKNADDIDVQFSGQIRQFGTADFSLNKARLDFNIPNWDKWYPLLHLPDLESKLEKFSAVSGSINYSGNAKEGKVEMQGALDKLKFVASGQIFPTLQTFDKVHFVLNHSDFTQLMKYIQPDQTWSSDWAVPVDFDGVVSKNSEELTWTNANIFFGKNKFKSSGQRRFNLLDLKIQANQLELGAFLPTLNNLNQIWSVPSDWPDMYVDVASDRFTYGDIQGEQLKLKASLQKQKWTISGLDCLIGDKQPGRFSLDGSIEVGKEIQPNIHLEWDRIQLGKKDLAFGPYRFAQGEISGNANIKSKGNSWASLISNATGQGRMTWGQGTLYGIDASAWLTAVQSALAAEQIGQSFSSHLQYALTNGKTALPELEGSFTANKGFLNFTDIHGSNDLVTLSGMVFDWALAKEGSHIKLPIILTAISKLPAVVFDFNYNAYSIQSIPFEQSFNEELRLKNRQSAEARQLQNLKATEVKNQQMRSEAQNIMTNMEQTLKQLQERVALRSDEGANQKLDDLNYTAREIRDLAVKVDLTPSEYAALLEKARLWAVQVTDLNNFYARQDLLNQRVKTNQLSPMVNTYLANIEQIYQQHPQSVILAEIVLNARKVAYLIKDDEAKLALAQDAPTVQSIVIRVQDNFDKIEKAHQYAQRLHLSLMNGGVGL